jgi:hypothetical protein
VSDVEISASHMGRWKRVVGIVLVFTSVASAVGCLMFFVEWVVSGLSNERIYVSLGRLPAVAWQAVLVTGMIGLPIAFAVGVLFALMAVLMGLRQLWYALLAAMIVLLLSGFLPAMVPVWRMDSFFLTHILVYLTVPSIVSWLVLRRWTSLLQS